MNRINTKPIFQFDASIFDSFYTREIPQGECSGGHPFLWICRPLANSEYNNAIVSYTSKTQTEQLYFY